MNRIEISKDVALSRLVYGMWRIADDTDTSPAHVRAKIDACLEQGITTMDQADIYGGYGAEAVLGAALKEDPSLRERIEIVSKCGIVAPMGRHSDKRVKHYDTSRAYIEQAVETSLLCRYAFRFSLAFPRVKNANRFIVSESLRTVVRRAIKC